MHGVDARAVLGPLREQLGDAFYEAWCRNLEIRQLGPARFEIAVPNEFFRDFLGKRLTPALTQAIAAHGVIHPEIEYRVDPSLMAAAAATMASGSIAGRPGATPLPVANVLPPAPIPRGMTTGSDDKRYPPLRTLGPGVGYAECNFTRMPFALVTDRATKRFSEIKIETKVRVNKETSERLWQVVPSRRGMPGPFDHAVFRALEKLALDESIRKAVPLERNVGFHVKRLIAILGLSYQTYNVKRVSEALDRLQELSIEELGVFRRSGKPAAAKRRKVHLIEAVRSVGELAAPGAIKGSLVVTFGQDYVESVNAGYVRPLDWELWRSLKRPIARRLVEILEMDFYGLRHSTYAAYTYPELCQLLPTTPQRQISKGQWVLNPAHEELAKAGYLTWEWEIEDDRAARVLYTPWPRWHAFQKELGHGEAPAGEESTKIALELGEPKRAGYYERLLAKIDRAYVNTALQDLRARVREGKAPENRAAWFMGALRQILGRLGITVEEAVGG